jgi:hypothetical protein
MPDWIARRSRYFWLSLAIGVVVALAALPSSTGALPNKIGDFVITVAVVAAIVRQAIKTGHAFMQGWREPRRRVPR